MEPTRREITMPNDLAPPPMIFREPPARADPLWAALAANYRADETAVDERLLAELELAPDALDRIAARARVLVAEVRRRRVGRGGLDAFLHEYALSSQEGVVLMCLAEALLRIPDAETADRLIHDKLRICRLGAPPRQERVDLRERLDLGPHAHRARRPARGSSRARAGCGLRPPRGAERRARHPPGHDAGDAHPGRTVRHGPHHPRGARARQGGGGARLPPFLRHAGRGGAHGRRCGALSRVATTARSRPLARPPPAADRSRHPASRSSSRPSIRATSWRSASACWASSSRASGRWRATRARPASA